MCVSGVDFGLEYESFLVCSEDMVFDWWAARHKIDTLGGVFCLRRCP